MSDHLFITEENKEKINAIIIEIMTNDRFNDSVKSNTPIFQPWGHLINKQ